MPAYQLQEFYCHKCGEKMTNTMWPAGYSVTNGRPVFYVYCQCPNHRHFWDAHNRYYRSECFGGDCQKILFYSTGEMVHSH